MFYFTVSKQTSQGQADFKSLNFFKYIIYIFYIYLYKSLYILFVQNDGPHNDTFINIF